jgi:hypothetical protein
MICRRVGDEKVAKISMFGFQKRSTPYPHAWRGVLSGVEKRASDSYSTRLSKHALQGVFPGVGR